MKITFSSITPDYDGAHYQLANVTGVVTVSLTAEEAGKFVENDDFIDTVIEYVNANMEDARFRVSSWSWGKYFAFDSWEIMLEPEEFEEIGCDQCGRVTPCPCHY